MLENFRFEEAPELIWVKHMRFTLSVRNLLQQMTRICSSVSPEDERWRTR